MATAFTACRLGSGSFAGFGPGSSWSVKRIPDLVRRSDGCIVGNDSAPAKTVLMKREIDVEALCAAKGWRITD